MNVVIVLCMLGSVAPDITTGRTTIIFNTEVEIVDVDADGVPVVFATYMGIGVNFDFLKLPLWAQEALIAHELGHVELGHIYGDPDIDRSMYYPLWKTVDPRERDADLYGADLIGVDTMINMLNYAYDLCIKIDAVNCATEAILRAEMLRGQYCI